MSTASEAPIRKIVRFAHNRAIIITIIQRKLHAPSSRPDRIVADLIREATINGKKYSTAASQVVKTTFGSGGLRNYVVK